MKISKSLKMFLKAMFLQAGKVATDKGELIYEGDELVEGAEVFIEKVDEEGNTELVPAEDGEYVAEDKVIVVAGGKVSEIRDKENGGGNANGEGGEGGEPASQESQEPNAEPANAEPDNNEESAEEKIARLEQNLAGALESIEGLTNRVAALEGKLAELEKPAAEPAETEQPKEEVEQKKSKLSYLKKD